MKPIEFFVLVMITLLIYIYIDMDRFTIHSNTGFTNENEYMETLMKASSFQP